MKSLSRSLSIIALMSVVTFSGCKEEQVLYETDQTSTTGPGGAATPPMAGGGSTAAASGNMQFERPPARDMLPLEKLKTHTVVGIEMAIPRDWSFRLSNSPMRAAEITAEDVDIVVFYFGQGQGGDAEANIRRWLSQVQVAPGWEPSLYQQRSNGLVVTEVIARGSYTPTAMGPAAPAPQTITDAILHGVVVEGGPQGSIFIRATGPIRAIEAARPGLETMVQLLRPVATE
jgi:hypothetical protein